LVASAPAALDTLNELALALGSDPNFSTTITNRLGAMDNSINIVYTKTTIDSSINTGFYNKTSIDTSVNTNFFNKTQIQNTYAPLSTPSFTGKITSAGDLSLNSKLSVIGDVSMNGNLYVASKSRFVSDVSLNGVVQVGSVFGGSKTAVANDLNVYGLNIGAGSFTSDSDCTLSGNLSISASKAIYGGSTTVGTSKLSVYGLSVGTGDITMNNNTVVMGTGSIYGGNTTAVNTNLSVYGLTTGVGGVTIPTSGFISGGGIAVGTSKLSVYGLNVGAGDINMGNNNIVTGVTGYIGINTTPTFPLHVNTFVANTTITANYGRLWQNATSASQQTSNLTNGNISIKTSSSIWAVENVYASSDIRIKTDINKINGNNALEKFRQLKPVEYYHIDKFESGTNKKYGFIAQEVKEIIPESISLHKDYVPNIYDAGTVIDNSLIVLDTKTTNEFTISGDILKIKLYDYKNQQKTVTLDKIINNSSFTIKEPLLDSDLSDNKIFVFGQEVNDFHILSKETVFTVATAALQEVDKELEKTKIVVYDISMNMPIYKTRLELAEQKIQEQSITISILQQQISYLQEQINEINKKINI
jgi:cytoskeletal protein CcmA (bactofilin family)